MQIKIADDEIFADVNDLFSKRWRIFKNCISVKCSSASFPVSCILLFNARAHTISSFTSDCTVACRSKYLPAISLPNMIYNKNQTYKNLKLKSLLS